MDVQKSFDEELKEIEAKIKNAEENEGDTEIRDYTVEKAELFNRHKKYDEAIQTYNLALKKTIETGKKMDIAFQLISIYLVLNNIEKIKENIDEIKRLLEKGGDWQRKNRLKVYEGIYNLIIRDFSKAGSLFVEVLPTFNATEIMTYETLVTYAILTGIISMDRASIKKKIIESSEVIMHLMKLPEVKSYLESFYYCRYEEFFKTFLWVIDYIKNDPYIKGHSKFFIRETRIIVYAQFLESYKTVKLSTMANDFGVGVDFLDRELAELISARKLPCRIDKVAGIIETDLTDNRSKSYKATVKEGDHLLNQIQKLSRAIDV